MLKNKIFVDNIDCLDNLDYPDNQITKIKTLEKFVFSYQKF